jgi:hypothetical protein
MEKKTNNQDRPATKRQLWALFLASKNAGEKKDFRNENLTFEQAAQLLQEYNKKTGYSKQTSSSNSLTVNTTTTKKSKPDYKNEFIKFFEEKYLDKVVANLKTVLKQVSEVYQSDTLGNDIGGRRWKFYGTGCAVAWLEFRKCKRYEEIDRATGSAYNNEIIEIIKSHISPAVIKQLENEGNYIEAIIGQDYSFRQLEMQARKQFLEINGAKNVRIRVHYD